MKRSQRALRKISQFLPAAFYAPGEKPRPVLNKVSSPCLGNSESSAELKKKSSWESLICKNIKGVHSSVVLV